MIPVHMASATPIAAQIESAIGHLFWVERGAAVTLTSASLTAACAWGTM
ncbi:MAG: hypothetical protein KF779_09455 [Hyphomonadaceae bacterium]|nr:hypothetical protein [Hyphomonadaceae bacterium]MCA8885475.1 hypothetical protein [Hyphomonadaceae bacterium]